MENSKEKKGFKFLNHFQASEFGSNDKNSTIGQSILVNEKPAQTNISFNHRWGKINNILRKSIVPNDQKTAFDLSVLNKSFNFKEQIGTEITLENSSNKKSLLNLPKMNEENKQETFNQASKLLEELYSSFSINIKDQNQLEKLDQGLYELIKKNYKNVIKS